MGKRKERWVCGETKDIPLDPAALKQHQPQGQEGKREAGGARTGEIVFGVSPALVPSRQD